MSSGNYPLKPSEQILYGEKIMEILEGVSGECFDATLQIVRALVDYQNMITTSEGQSLSPLSIAHEGVLDQVQR